MTNSTKLNVFFAISLIAWGLWPFSLAMWVGRERGSWGLATGILLIVSCVALWKIADEVDRSVPTWEPIESAPRDGTTILVYSTEEDEISMVEWYRGCHTAEAHWYVVYAYDGDSGDNVYVLNPTHWMPLPEVPK